MTGLTHEALVLELCHWMHCNQELVELDPVCRPFVFVCSVRSHYEVSRRDERKFGQQVNSHERRPIGAHRIAQLAFKYTFRRDEVRTLCPGAMAIHLGKSRRLESLRKRRASSSRRRGGRYRS